MEYGLKYFGSYDHHERTFHFTNEQGQALQLLDMLNKNVQVRFILADDMLPGFGFDPHKPIDTLIAKVESVNADKDGVSLKLTTERITNGKFAKKKVKESLERVKSGEYSVGFVALADKMSYFDTVAWSSILPYRSLFPLAVELEVERDGVKMKPMEEKILKYDAKEDKVGSVASEKVMAEIGKKLEEDEDVNSVRLRLLVKMKDGNELTLSIRSLEKYDDMVWLGNIKGSKKTLDYLKSEIRNVDEAALLRTMTDWPGGDFLGMMNNLSISLGMGR